tara:strand:- start:1908 stop:5324 length:3417 start_codon:yes stop_codon:yes gene_type:complete
MRNQEIKTKLFHPRTDKFNFLALLKQDYDYSTFRKMTKGILQHPFGKNALLANPLPKSISELRRNNITPHSGNVDTEIAWIMHSIEKNAEVINKYILLKKMFEKHILLNEYEKAENCLNKIEKEICYSNWGAQNRLLLLEEKDGTESNWLMLGKYSEQIKDPLSLFIIEQSSKKAEKKLAYSRYKASFESIISETTGLLNEYLCFKILYPAFTGFEKFSFFINVESVSSIIDRYNILIDVLIELIPLKRDDLIKNVIDELLPIIKDDNRLVQIQNILGHQFMILNNVKEITLFISEYSLGNYEYCLNKSTKLFRTHPDVTEIYIIYVKCLIELKFDFRETKISLNIDSILQKLYDLYSLKVNFNNTIDDLFKISAKYDSFNFGKQLFPIIAKQANYLAKGKVDEFYYSIYSKFNNPVLINNLKQFDKEFINKIAKGFRANDNSIFTKINLYILDGNVDGLKQLNISKNRKQIYIAKALLAQNKYDELISHIELEIINEDLSIVTLKTLLEILFQSYLIKDEIIKALNLYIKYFFKRKYLVHRLNHSELHRKLNIINSKVNSIDWPIFYFLSNPDSYDQYVKYDEFLEYIGVDRPTKLLENKKIENKKLVFFLKEICNVDVMHHSLNFNGTDDIENERINILQGLILIDKINEGDYIKEITEVTKKAAIRNAIREVNKGRITLNTQQLKTKEERNIKDNFSRFEELVIFSNEHNVKSLDPTSKMLNKYFNLLQDSLRNKIVNRNDPAFIAFKSMFIDLRDKFVLSKDYGLDGYLSTRIRHGTLLNHIRSNFESLNLVSQKSGKDYIDNSYWDDKLPYNLIDKREGIQDLIKKFSLKVDEFTELIIKELIQVKTEKYDQKPNAYFDFTLSDPALAYLFTQTKNEVKSYSEFLDFVFEYLEKQVEVRLKSIRESFDTVIKQKYTSLINDFDAEIRELLEGESFVDLTNSIVKCQTNIQTELNNIGEWFNISNPSSESILDVETIIHTAIEITNTIYPNQNINPEIQVDTRVTFRIGTTNLIYIFRIMLDNIIKHSGLPKTKRNISIYSDIKNNKSLVIEISNDFNPEKLDIITSNLNQTKISWSAKENHFTKSNIEGGSGFDKIRRILAVDMKMDTYNFDYIIKGNRLKITIDIQIQLTGS